MTVEAESPISVPEPHTGHPEITMAPLIDVVFLLLIFFMVATVFPDNNGLTIEKPESALTSELPKKNMVFTVSKDGEIRFDSRTVSVEEVERIVREHIHGMPQTFVLLEVDRRATTADLIKVMDACKLGGAEKLAIATDVNKARR